MRSAMSPATQPHSPTGSPRTACSGRARARRSRGATCCCRFRRWCCRSPSGWCGAWSSWSCRASASGSPPTSCSGSPRCRDSPARSLRLFFSFLVPVFGGRTWTTLSTAALLDSDDRPRARGAGSRHRLSDVAGARARGRHRRRQLRVEHGERQLLLSGRPQGRGARLERGARQPRRRPGADRRCRSRSARASSARSAGPRCLWHDGAATREIWLQNAGYVWVPLIVAAALAAWFGMDDLGTVKASFETQAVIFMRKHNWILSWLYLGTFGSFIGFAAGFPLVARDASSAAPKRSRYAYVGPLLGALARPVGGYLADRHGGARIALGCVRRDGARRRRDARRRRGREARRLHDVPRAVLAAVRRERRGQRRRLPDDPRRVRRGPPARVRRSGRRAARGRCAKARSKARRRSASRPRSRRSAASSFRRPTARRSPLTGGTAAALYPFLAFYLSCARGDVVVLRAPRRRAAMLTRHPDRRTGPARSLS